MGRNPGMGGGEAPPATPYPSGRRSYTKRSAVSPLDAGTARLTSRRTECAFPLHGQVPQHATVLRDHPVPVATTPIDWKGVEGGFVSVAVYAIGLSIQLMVAAISFYGMIAKTT